MYKIMIKNKKLIFRRSKILKLKNKINLIKTIYKLPKKIVQGAQPFLQTFQISSKLIIKQNKYKQDAWIQNLQKKI